MSGKTDLTAIDPIDATASREATPMIDIDDAFGDNMEAEVAKGDPSRLKAEQSQFA